jgi:opacity protein-like surface antigen
MGYKQSMLSAAAAAILLAGCAATPQQASFDPAAVAWSTQAGKNTLAGVARVQMADGKTRSCAKQPVRLAPDSGYARERMQALYGNTEAGYVDAQEAQRVREQAGLNVDQAYEQSLKTAACNSKGRFVFKNLPDGTYYVMAPVVWRNKHASQNDGGYFMQRVTIGGGETLRVTMTRPVSKPLETASR